MTIALDDLDFKVGEIEQIRLRKLKDMLTHLQAAALITGNANITAFASLVGAADKVPYFTGPGALALADFPAFGRTLVANVTAADARTDLAISATNTPFTPTGNIAATDVQAALAELDTEKLAVSAVTEAAQDAVGAMVDASLVYVDATPLLTRAALTGDATAAQGSNAVTVVKINGVSLAGLATGILKNTTATGAPSIAVAADFPTLNQNTTGSAAKLTTGRTIGITGDATWSSGAFDGSANVTAAITLATVNANVGSFGSATQAGTFTVNGKGLITAAANVTITPAFSSLTGKPTTLSGYGITDAQPLDTDLTTIAGLTATTDNFIVSVSSAWASRTPAQVRTTLGVTGTGADTAYAFRANNLSDLANAGTARTNLGLGTMATQAASAVAITGGTAADLSAFSVTSAVGPPSGNQADWTAWLRSTTTAGVNVGPSLLFWGESGNGVAQYPFGGIHIVKASAVAGSYSGKGRALVTATAGNIVEAFNWTESGVNVTGSISSTTSVSAATSYKVASIQVVGAQQAAIADVLNTTAAHTTGINAILAVMRTHGLIAT